MLAGSAWVRGSRNAFIGAVHRLAMRLDDQIALVAGALSSDSEKCLTGLALYHCGDPASRIEATADSRPPNFDAALSCVVYSHLDRRGEGALTLTQGTCACRVDTDGAKRRRGGHDRRAAGLHDRSRRTGFRFQRSKSLGGVTVTRFRRHEDGWQDDRLPGSLGRGSGCGDCGRTTGSAATCADRGSNVCSTADARARPHRCALRTGAHSSADSETAGLTADACVLSPGRPDCDSDRQRGRDVLFHHHIPLRRTLPGLSTGAG